MKKIITAVVLIALLIILGRGLRNTSGNDSEPASRMTANENAAPSSVLPAATEGGGSGSVFTGEEADLLLTLHNRARAAAGTRPLKWSEELARYAQEWADHLAASATFDHRPESGRWKQLYGENLYMGTAAYYGLERAVDAWVEEKSRYNGGPISEANVAAAGHYTQVVWKNTRAMGCGKALRDGQLIVVCNYDPAGNVEGERPW
ncbi:MAG TPA: CAP family protein [bacterium]|nr:CAP family protein [bacterium]